MQLRIIHSLKVRLLLASLKLRTSYLRRPLGQAGQAPALELSIAI